MTFPEWFFLAFLVLVVVVVIAWSRVRMKRTARSWKRIAERFKGTFRRTNESSFREPHYTVDCTAHGVPLKLEYTVQSTGRSQTYWTHVTTPCDRELEFEISEEGIFHKIGKSFGLEDVQVEDGEYDDAFLIKASHPEDFRRRCNDQFRHAHLAQRACKLRADGETLAVIRRGLVSHFEDAVDLVEFAALAGKTFGPRV